MGLLEARSVKKWGNKPTRLEASNTWGNSVHTLNYARESPDAEWVLQNAPKSRSYIVKHIFKTNLKKSFCVIVPPTIKNKFVKNNFSFYLYVKNNEVVLTQPELWTFKTGNDRLFSLSYCKFSTKLWLQTKRQKFLNAARFLVSDGLIMTQLKCTINLIDYISCI